MKINNIIDTHCHLYESEYSNAKKIIDECNNKNILLILNGVDKKVI